MHPCIICDVEEREVDKVGGHTHQTKVFQVECKDVGEVDGTDGSQQVAKEQKGAGLVTKKPFCCVVEI